MSEKKTKDGLPVSGYTPQSPEAILVVNGFKQVEENILASLDALADCENFEPDAEWLAAGRLQLQQAFMCINRSVFKPERLNK